MVAITEQLEPKDGLIELSELTRTVDTQERTEAAKEVQNTRSETRSAVQEVDVWEIR